MKKIAMQRPNQDEPRLPHQRDEEREHVDHAGPKGVPKGARDIIKQAHDDIVNGQQDTDLHDQRSLEDTQEK